MTNSDSAGNGAEPIPVDPDSTGSEEERSPESWIDRLKAVVGLRPSASIREDLGEPESETIWRQGCTMPTEKAIQFALSGDLA